MNVRFSFGSESIRTGGFIFVGKIYLRIYLRIYSSLCQLLSPSEQEDLYLRITYQVSCLVKIFYILLFEKRSLPYKSSCNHSICGLTVLLAFSFLSQARFILVTIIFLTHHFTDHNLCVNFTYCSSSNNAAWLNKNLSLHQLLILMIHLVQILLDHFVSSSFHFGAAYLMLGQPWRRFLRL